MADGLALPYTFYASGENAKFATQQNFQHVVTYLNRFVSGVGMDVFVGKTADQSVTSSTTLVDADELLFAAAPNSRYSFSGFFTLVSASSTPGLRIGLLHPDGIFRLRTTDGDSVSGTGETSVYFWTGTLTANVPLSLWVVGYLATDAAGGEYKIQFCQHVSDPTATTLRAGSWFRFRKVV